MQFYDANLLAGAELSLFDGSGIVSHRNSEYTRDTFVDCGHVQDVTFYDYTIHCGTECQSAA